MKKDHMQTKLGQGQKMDHGAKGGAPNQPKHNMGNHNSGGRRSGRGRMSY